MPGKLQWRLIIPLSLVIVVSMSLLGVLLARASVEDQTQILTERLAAEAALVAVNVQPLLAEQPAVNRLAKELGAAAGIRITLIDLSGVVIGDSHEDSLTMENHLFRPEVQDALETGYGESRRLSATTNQETLYIAIPIRDGNNQPQAVVRLSLPLSEVRALTNRSLAAAATGAGAALLIALAGSWIITRTVTRPVGELTRAVRETASGSLGHTVSRYGRGEIRELAVAFNTMSLKLGETINRLSQNSETLSAILSHITDGVLLTDASGNIVLSNRAAGAIFNFDENSAAGKSAVEVLRDHQAVELLRGCLMTGRGKTLQFESAVRQRLLYANVLPLPYGKSGGALLLLQDLTDILTLQTMRKELIGNISHEFLTPLAGIAAIAETLRDGALEDTPVARDFLAKILAETERLSQMVTELGELARIEGGNPQLKMEMTDINRLVRETIEEIKPLAEKNHLKLESYLTQGLPSLQADPDRLRHVLLNLMHNAIKFTPADGMISLASRLERGEVVITVADTGIGITPEALPHVFERFYKGDRSRSKSGSGLGLAIVKHTVQAHGGRVWVESAPGRGARFSFSLPVPAHPE